MTGFALFVLLVFGIIVFVKRRAIAEMFSSPAPTNTPVTYTLAPYQFSTTLLLPSSLSALKFSCPVTISYRLDENLAAGQDAARLAEWEVYQIAQSVASQYSLTVSEHLDMALNHVLNPWRKPDKSPLTIRAQFDRARVDPKDLQLARQLEQARFELDMESNLHDARVRHAERLGRLLSEPRLAALFWLVRHPDRVEDLPRITETMFALDLMLNHRPAVTDAGALGEGVEPTQGQDLDRFLVEADEDKRTLLCNSLAFAYEQLGQPQMADRARELTDLAASEAPSEPSQT